MGGLLILTPAEKRRIQWRRVAAFSITQHQGAVMATKAAYESKLQAQLKQWDAKLDELSAKAQKATAEARIKYENDLESLKSKRAAALRMLEDLGKRSESAWEDMKDGVERAWDEMGKAIEHIAARFK
jgi:hypothetical protein